MPKLSGFEVCQKMREAKNDTPVVIITGLSSVSNKVNALNEGADDYITKPFSFVEVLARVKAVLRRSNIFSDTIQIDNNLTFNISKKKLISSSGEEVYLTDKESSILKLFCLNKGKIINKEILCKEIWDMSIFPQTNFCEVTVKNYEINLRKFQVKNILKIFTEKVISLLSINKSKIYLTESVKRLTFTNTIIFLTLLILFNSILIIFINKIYRKDLDHRIEHEINLITKAIQVSNDDIISIDSSEILDPDLYYITDNPCFLQIYDSSNKILISSRNLELYKNISVTYKNNLNDIYFENFSFHNENFRAGYYPIKNQSGEQIAVLRLNVFDKTKSILFNNLIIFNLIGIPLSMIFLFFLSLIGAKIVFKPLNNIISTAQRINQNNLSERIIIDASPDDEIGKLRDTLNELFDKIENYINELKHFTDLVSHQLMNPITAIITEIEYVLKRDRSIEEYKASLQRLEEKVDSMANIIKTLLLIARSEKSKTKSEFVFNFSKLLRKEIENYFSKNYLNNNFNLKTHIEDELYLRGEAEKFSMVLQNLFSNAKKFSIDSLDVTIKAFKNNNKIILEVADKGIGIDDDDKIKVFNKFYRTEKAEKLGILGFGLGLNLVKTIVEEASGKIEILDNHPNGTIIKITLPSIELED